MHSYEGSDNMPRLNGKRREQGITLVEVIVVMALVGFLMIPIYTLMDTNNKISERTSDLIAAQNIATSIYDFIEEELRYANTIEIGSTVVDKLKINISEPDSVTNSKKAYSMVVDANEFKYYTTVSPRIERVVFDADYMQGLNVSIDFSQMINPSSGLAYTDRISLVIDVKRIDGIEYRLGPTTIMVENIKVSQRPGDRIGGTSGSVVNYTLPD